MPGQTREFQDYLIKPTQRSISHKHYMRSPAIAFLKYAVDAKDAVNCCLNKFEKNANGSFNKNALISLQHITAAMVPALMGHFETYQRYLFAGMFEHSSLLKDFNVEAFFKELKKRSNIEIDPIRLAAYRGYRASAGIILADTLEGWHNPNNVNDYFNAYKLDQQLYSNQNRERLEILWQLRHSIVHTGGTITLPDAQKLKKLHKYGNKAVAFDNQIILAIARKLHTLVRDATGRMKQGFENHLVSDFEPERRASLDKLFKVDSSMAVWLR
jgi:hypothetical protein